MGTRADFYVGRGGQAEWLGSIAWDGYPGGIAGQEAGRADGDVASCSIFAASSQADYRAAVERELAHRHDATLPEQGWPWPWMDSSGTDYAYAFDSGRVWASRFGRAWFKATEPEPEERGPGAVFPDMSSRRSVTTGKRSGLLIFRPRQDSTDE